MNFQNTLMSCNTVSVYCIKSVCVLVKVCSMDLRDASHEQAVDAIRRAGDSVVFLVQSGQHRSQVVHLTKQKIVEYTVQCIFRHYFTTLCVTLESLDAPNGILIFNTCK